MTKQINQLTPALVANDSDLAVIRQGSQDKRATIEQILDNIGTALNRATTKATPADADEIGFSDTEASNVIKKFTWANLKTLIGTYISALALTFTNKTISGSTNTITNLSASNLSTGTIPNARFPATLPAASGVNLTNLVNLDADELVTGTVARERLPEDVATNHGNMGATETIDLSVGEYHYGTLDVSCELTLANAPSTGNVGFVILELTQGSGGQTITFTNTVLRDDGAAPLVLSTGAGDKDYLILWTRDGGTTYTLVEGGFDFA